jgi:hypothetical protein
MKNVSSFKKILLVNILSVMPVFALAGGAGPGGGDAIRCNDGKTYALDFELTTGSTLAPAVSLSDKGQYPTSGEILKTMANGLRKMIPALGASLDDFRSFNEVPLPNEKRLWINTDNPLVYLDDQDIDVTPQNCLDRSGKPNVWQAIVRTPVKNGFVIYKRDPKALEELSKNSAIQVSFMQTHEWLRDYTDDVKVIRNVNRYLHSLKWMSLNGEGLRTVLSEFGLTSISKMKTVRELEAERKANAANAQHVKALREYDRQVSEAFRPSLQQCQNIAANDRKGLEKKYDCLVDLSLKLRAMLRMDASDEDVLNPTLHTISNWLDDINAALDVGG